jgi:hypothetical protein
MTLDMVKDVFVQRLPTLQKMARISFRHLSSPEAREESVTNAIALAWKGFHSLARKGREQEPGILDSVMRFSIRQTRAGRLPQGCPRKRDVLAPRWVGPTRMTDFDITEFVGRSTPIPDAVSFRVDVPQFMGTLPERNRNLALDLAQGMTTGEVAAKYDLSPGRISQFRREFKQLFDAFFAA